jgi:hypothetical protein
MEKFKIQGDNQQQSLDLKLSWLGGIIDGEGMVTLIKRDYKTQNGFAPRISIVNTDLKIINEVSEICNCLNLAYYIQKKEGKGTWKTKYELLFGGIKRCNKFLPYIIPFLIAKKEKAELLKEYCNIRLSLPIRSPIGNREKEIALQIRKGHTTGPKSNMLRDSMYECRNT